MKKLISGILCTALAVTCLCGCEKSSGDRKKGKETIYLLKEVVQTNDAGEMIYNSFYEYNNRGLVTSEKIDLPAKDLHYDENKDEFVAVDTVCDGVINYENNFVYDQQGNLVNLKGEMCDYLFGEELRYEYDYGGKSGEITDIRIYRDGSNEPYYVYELKYKNDGTIELWVETSSEDKIMRTWETSGGQIEKIEWSNKLQGSFYYAFEYDRQGNVTEFSATKDNRPYANGTRSYDEKGRVTAEEGLLVGSGAITYGYEGDRLATINDHKLTYQQENDGELVITYQDYTLTYEVVEMEQDEIELVCYRWNQFCRGYGAAHYAMGMYGVHYPIFDSNTVLLLPRVIC